MERRIKKNLENLINNLGLEQLVLARNYFEKSLLELANIKSFQSSYMRLCRSLYWKLCLITVAHDH